jgi:hypothetical protein
MDMVVQDGEVLLFPYTSGFVNSSWN